MNTQRTLYLLWLVPVLGLLGIAWLAQGCEGKSGKDLTVKKAFISEFPAPPKVYGESSESNGIPVEDVISDLANMPAPSGVDENAFQFIKRNFQSELEKRREISEYIASGVPRGEAGKVWDLEAQFDGEDTVLVSWSYFNVGDYNQNGRVEISDITPLAEHFMEKRDETNNWIDGDGNQQINIADISPLAENFFSEVAGYLVEAEDVEGTWETVAEVPFIVSTGGITSRRRFSQSFGAKELSGFSRLRVVPFDSAGHHGSEGRLAAVAFPIPVFTTVPASGDAPLLVTFDASASYDPDGGNITKYEWDLDGDGVYEVENLLTFTHTFETGGDFTVALKVTDDEEFAGTSSQSVTVNIPEWLHTWRSNYTWTNPATGDVHTADQLLEDFAIDQEGNLIAVGYIYFPGAGPYDAKNVLLMKWTQNGDLLFKKRWGSFVGENPDIFVQGYGETLALDQVGNIIIAGNTTYFGEQVDGKRVLVIKADPDGNVIWSRSLGRAGKITLRENADSLVLDDVGNIYVGGSAGYDPHVLLLKLDADGNVEWDMAFGLFGGKSTFGDVELLPNGNILLGVTIEGLDRFWDVALLEITGSGDIVRQRLLEVESRWISVSHIEVSDEGLIYIVGGMTPGSFTACLNSSMENILWSKDWTFAPAGVQKKSFVVLPSGELLVVGMTLSLELFPNNYFIGKLTADTIEGFSTSEDEVRPYPTSIEFPPSIGKLFIAGSMAKYGAFSLNELIPSQFDLPMTLRDGTGAVPIYYPGVVDVGVDLDFVDLDEGAMDDGGALVMKLDPGRL